MKYTVITIDVEDFFKAEYLTNLSKKYGKIIHIERLSVDYFTIVFEY